FLMKAYLPVKLLRLSRSACAFMDMLGLISSQVRLFKPDDVQKLLTSLEESSNSNAIEKITDKMIEALVKTASAKPKSVVGLIGGHHVNALSSLLQWPTTSYLEPYAFVLPSIVNERNLSIISDSMKHAHEYLITLREATRKFDEVLDRHVSFLSAKTSSSVSGRLKRLEERLKTLEDEISYLESRKEQFSSRKDISTDTQKRINEIESSLKARTSAYERDMERKKKLEAEVSDTTDSLSTAQDKLRGTIKKVWIDIEKVKKEYESVTGQYASGDETDDGDYLLIPLYLAGLSRKGQLRVVIVPPKQLMEDPEKVSLRRDFVYPFATANSQADVLIRILTERANQDIAFRKTLRDASRERNLLALEPSRALLKEGAGLLLADGLAKPSEIQELESYLANVPPQSMELRVPKRITGDTSSGDACKVIFSVFDDTGSPVENAVIEIGPIRLQTNSSGRSDVVLAFSNYEGIVEARGYKRKSFDFTLSKTGDIVLPLVLTELSHEEKLDLELDSLVGRAERIALIKSRLAEAFDKHGDTLLQIPAYRNVLVEMLIELGLEPESWIAEAKKQRGMMQRLLRRDEREERIRRDILRIAEESKQAGGIMLLSELILRMDSLGWEISADFLENMIKDMAKEGLLEGVTSLENGAKLVKFIPVALTDDPQKILSLASQNDGRISIEEAVVELNWTEERVRNALDLLVANGVAKLQRSFSRSTQYWFPGLKGRKT
ncbi:MAG: hypothetical protein ACFFED_12515, partial [Candidatus Thorarchaeota archaeon]